LQRVGDNPNPIIGRNVLLFEYADLRVPTHPTPAPS
jgi:hypothetical protein